jgi:type I restriction enzyme S subunit
MAKKKRESRSVPKLRFPAFQKPWARESIAPYLEECGGRVGGSTAIPIYTSSRGGLTLQTEYYSGRALVNDGEYGVVPPGCIVYRHMSDDGRFAFNTNETGREIAVSKEYPVFQAINLDRRFLLAKLNYSLEFKSFAVSQKAGGTRTRLYFSKLQTWKTLLPSLAEQQKIADCLASLDEVLAIQRRKAEALRAHRAGLMQQLFPREGENVPRLRFHQFRDRPEWSVVPLGALIVGKPGYGVNAPAVPYSKELPTYLRITDISDDGRFLTQGKASVDIDASDDNYMSEGDIALARTGASVGKSYRYRKEDGRLVFAGFLIRIRPDGKKVVPALLSSFLRTPRYWEWVRFISARSGQPGINGNEYAALPIPIPPPSATEDPLAEQHRIADCFSSLDTQITAVAQRLDALHFHKKGLMQQLFPSAATD